MTLINWTKINFFNLHFIMVLSISQLNIQSWNTKECQLECELVNTLPDLILLNEVGNPKEGLLKLMNYNTISSALGLYLGAAILINPCMASGILGYQ